jgi:hypothetical protein
VTALHEATREAFAASAPSSSSAPGPATHDTSTHPVGTSLARRRMRQRLVDSKVAARVKQIQARCLLTTSTRPTLNLLFLRASKACSHSRQPCSDLSSSACVL